MRLINAVKLLEDLKEDEEASEMPLMWHNGIMYAEEHINLAPTVDAIPVRHGRWIFIRDEGGGNSLYSCSECGQGDIHCPEVVVPYCWHCGAKMDAERREE